MPRAAPGAWKEGTAMATRWLLILMALSLSACATSGGGSRAEPSGEESEGTPEPTARVTARPTARSTASPEPREELTIVESGFTYFPGDTEYVQYAIVFENPNPSEWVAERTSVTLTWYDSAGGVAGSEQAYLSLGLPGQRVALGGVAFDVANPAEMDIQFRVGDWTRVDFTPGQFTFSGVTTTNDQFGGHTTKGIIHSSFDEDQEFVSIVAVYKDATGNVLGGDSGYAQFVPAGGQIGFEVSPLGEWDDIATTDVYAAP